MEIIRFYFSFVDLDIEEWFSYLCLIWFFESFVFCFVCIVIIILYNDIYIFISTELVLIFFIDLKVNS